jgi:hypothetical protein
MPVARHTSANHPYGTPLLGLVAKSLLTAMGMPVGVAARVSRLSGAVVRGALGAVAEQRRVGGGVVVPAAAALL